MSYLPILREVFGYDAFRGPQQAIIDHVAAGGDALVLMPTGGGKSLCYQVPAIVREREGRGVTIVVSPLIALMHDQVGALEEAGVIRGYHADPDPRKLGWEITFFAIVGLESQKETVLEAFETLVASWPEARECHMIRGGGDFLVKFVARDTAHENQLTQRLTGSPTVSRVQTLQTIRTSRNLAGVPFP